MAETVEVALADACPRLTRRAICRELRPGPDSAARATRLLLQSLSHFTGLAPCGRALDQISPILCSSASRPRATPSRRTTSRKSWHGSSIAAGSASSAGTMRPA